VLGTVLMSQASKLVDVVPPVGIATAHQTLINTFGEFARAVAGVSSLAESNRICAGVSAVSKITSDATSGAFRSAIRDLGTVDANRQYKFGAFLPAATSDTFRQLANNTFLKKGPGGGSGKFKLDNKSQSETVISLVAAGGKTPLFTMYVRAGANATASGIKNGSYDVYMTEGIDWDSGIGAFTRNCSYEKFTSPLAFKATSTKYDFWTITTGSGGAAPGSEAPTDDVDPADFPTG
jgi:hypothetical protein